MQEPTDTESRPPEASTEWPPLLMVFDQEISAEEAEGIKRVYRDAAAQGGPIVLVASGFHLYQLDGGRWVSLSNPSVGDPGRP